MGNKIKTKYIAKMYLKINDFYTKQLDISPKTVSHSKRLILKDVFLKVYCNVLFIFKFNRSSKMLNILSGRDVQSICVDSVV